ncbi:type II toxin-antitoxin system VapC family toxin [Sporichthya sp.]|uniref:type II toxin-antitoxin system VapC family toxin n=1 Tax=Sporichthya sp. TaxID=65475 RepID=UPI001814BF24|nr:type II toxin-antitoxin system VapC family toxin [Sporichthya sp.]MBA3744531.1 type II toxin-antitoxin system VapC family toxin [Sporichthya sp.]
MIVLDTNVLSELIRPNPSPAVLAWFDTQPADRLATTAVTAGEMFAGVERLSAGRRRRALSDAVTVLLGADFAGRVMPFDFAATGDYAAVMATRQKAGRPMSVLDAQIAAICRDRGARLATRNTSDFEGTGVELINPWDA